MVPALTQEWSVDDLARLAGLPVRRVREYQSLGILPPPRREGRVGRYGLGHLRRLELIAQLRARGHSLAGIGDLLVSWRQGADLGDLLGLDPDELVHVDEPGVAVTTDQLSRLLPRLVPDHLAALEATGVVEACGEDRWCVPSPSLVQLTADALGSGLAPAAVLELLDTIRAAADTVADQVVHRLEHLPAGVAPETTVAFLRRARGLLAHGVGRLTLHRVGRRLGGTEAPGGEDLIQRVVRGGRGIAPGDREACPGTDVS